MTDNLNPEPDATTFDRPAKRRNVVARCLRSRCPYHSPEASDDSLTTLTLLCRDAAPYLLRGYFCICNPCLYDYAFRCGVLHGLLVDAIERLTEIPIHMIEHEQRLWWGGQIRSIRLRNGALYSYPHSL